MTKEEALQKLEFERKWLSDAGYNAYNVDIAFDSIRNIIKVFWGDENYIPIPTLLDKIRAEIEIYEADCRLQGGTDEYEWVLGCDIVKYLKLTSDLYFLGDVEQIKLFGLPVKVDFKEPNKTELRERVPEPVDFKTTKEDKYLLGCLHAISKLLDEGSVNFVIQIDGEWESIPWTEICEWIDSQMEGE